MEKCAHIIIYGQVQKAGFRDFIDEIAFYLNLKGYVKNLDDGTVQIICEGKDDNIKELLEKINITQYPIRVENIDVVYKKSTSEYKTFKIIREEDLTTATYERMDAAVRYIREMNSNLSQKIDGVGDKIDGVGDKIDGVGDKIDGVGDKIDGVSDKINEVGDKIDRVSDKIDGVGDKIDRVSDKIDGVGDKIDRVSDKINGVGDKIDRVSDKINEVGDKIDQNRIEITTEICSSRDDFKFHFNERISLIEQDIAQIKAKIMLNC